MTTLWQDIRYGVRVLVKSPRFTVVVIAILGIGIGATTAMLSVVDAVMFRSCPYKNADRLACVWETWNPERANRNFTSLTGFRDWCEQQNVFERLVGAHQWNGIVRTADRAEPSRGFSVTGGFFSVLGASPALGRTFLSEEHRAGATRVAVLSHDHWQHWFGGDPNVIGRTIRVSDEAYTVVGVLPRDFRWVFQGVACGLWMPLSLDSVGEVRRDYRSVQVIGQLKTGTSVEQARAQMDLIAERLAQAYPETNTNCGIQVVPIDQEYRDRAVGSGKPQTLLILLGVVVAVLLIACVHVANLLVARSAAREQEIAVRAALGAHRIRIVRQLFTESVLLAVCGGLLGLFLAHVGIEVLSAARARSIPWYVGAGGGAIPWFVDVHMDVRLLLYVLGLSLSTCVLFGILPAIGATRIDLNRRLSTTRTWTAGARFQRLRNALVIADIALAFVLLAAAGLLVNSYLRILRIDPRLNPHNVLTACVAFDWQRGPEPPRRLAIFQEALRRVRSLPGVQGVAASGYYSPTTGSFSTPSFRIEGRESTGEGAAIPCTEVFPGYFHLLQIPLLYGRSFTEYDDRTRAPVIVINEAMARRFWPNENPVGKHILDAAKSDSPSHMYEIVGVVGNVWHARYGLDEPELYAPYLQGDYPTEVFLMIRTSSDPAALSAAVRRELTAVAEGAAVDHIVPLEGDIAALFASERTNMLFLAAFAGAALLLASIGVYETTAYAVSWRTHEIGIRMALGARRVDVIGTVLRHGLWLTLGGIALGLTGALMATRVIRSLLHDVSVTDPLTFVCVSVLLAGVSLLACYIPARRAARIDPMAALRYE